jgi:hypothetical protein
MPTKDSMSCESCAFGLFSSAGHLCEKCPNGRTPNLNKAATDCTQCSSSAYSLDGSVCKPCPPDQEANPARTACVCHAFAYNSSLYDGWQIQCVAKSLSLNQIKDNRKATATCLSCHHLGCVDCVAAGLELVTGWGTTGSASPWYIYKCPFKRACVNTRGQRCAVGHSGLLCAVCQPGYGLTSEECIECKTANHWWHGIVGGVAVLSTCGLVVYLSCYHKWKRKPTGNLSMVQLMHDMQLSENPLAEPLHPSRSDLQSSPRGSLSQRVRSTAERSKSIYLLFRVVYQPVRILVGYVQVYSPKALQPRATISVIPLA